jgi:hypothetical protein
MQSEQVARYPPTNQQSTLDSNTLDRGVLSGTQHRVGFFYSINPDCSLIGYPTIHIKTPPAPKTQATLWPWRLGNAPA